MKVLGISRILCALISLQAHDTLVEALEVSQDTSNAHVIEIRGDYKKTIAGISDTYRSAVKNEGRNDKKLKSDVLDVYGDTLTNNIPDIKGGNKKATSGCYIDIQTDLSHKSPIILNEHLQIIMPDSETGLITLERDQEVMLACVGEENYFTDTRISEDVKLLEASCYEGSTFEIEDRFLSKQVTCSKTPRSTLKRTNSKCNGGNYTAAEIGFYITENKFIKLIDICFDEKEFRTVYTKHILRPEVEIRQYKKKFKFKETEDNLFEELDESPSVYYTCRSQEAMLNVTLGSKERVSTYLNCSVGVGSPNQLVKGHLSPNADFVFSYEQKATYYHANAAPQYQFCNNRNWKSLEQRVRAHSIALDSELVIYTGTSKEMTYLSDTNNTYKNIFLDYKMKKLPAPLYYWKLVFDPVSKSGIGFINYNIHFRQNLKFTAEPHHGHKCKNTLWFDGKERKRAKCLIYCMSVSELLQITGLKDFSKSNVRNIMMYMTEGNNLRNEINRWNLS